MLYVDESGDTGMIPGASPIFALSGLVLHELVWHDFLAEIIAFRGFLRKQYGLKLREEIHAGRFFHKAGELARIRKDLRLRILREVLDFQARQSNISIINVVLKKQSKTPPYDVFDSAWMVLLQRFHNTISHRNFPGPRNAQDYGIVVVDRTEEKKLRALTRRLRRYNPVPHLGSGGYRSVPLMTIVEDPIHRDSLHSYIIQLADVNAYFLYQKHHPNGYVRTKGARNYFDRLDPVLCKRASRTQPQGIVYV